MSTSMMCRREGAESQKSPTIPWRCKARVVSSRFDRGLPRLSTGHRDSATGRLPGRGEAHGARPADPVPDPRPVCGAHFNLVCEARAGGKPSVLGVNISTCGWCGSLRRGTPSGVGAAGCHLATTASPARPSAHGMGMVGHRDSVSLEHRSRTLTGASAMRWAQVRTYLERQWTKILAGRVSVQDFVFAKEVRAAR